jgi:hypothetical protein
VFGCKGVRVALLPCLATQARTWQRSIAQHPVLLLKRGTAGFSTTTARVPPLTHTQKVMYLTALVAKLGAVLATGWAEDKGLPVCWAGAVNGVVGAALNFGSAAVVNAYTPGGSVAGAWVMQVCLLGWTGFALALLPTVGCNAFPPEVRASGAYSQHRVAQRPAHPLAWQPVESSSGHSPPGAQLGSRKAPGLFRGCSAHSHAMPPP